MTPKTPPEVEEIKPCPFCGGTDSVDNVFQEAMVNLVHHRNAMGRAYRVECNCGGNGSWSNDHAEAVAAWNTRALAKVTDEREAKIAFYERILGDIVSYKADAEDVFPDWETTAAALAGMAEDALEGRDWLADALERGEHLQGEG